MRYLIFLYFFALSWSYQVLDDGAIVQLDEPVVKSLSVLNLSTQNEKVTLQVYLSDVPTGQAFNQVNILSDYPEVLELNPGSSTLLGLKFTPQPKILPGQYKYIVVFRQVMDKKIREERVEELEHVYYLPVIAEIK